MLSLARLPQPRIGSFRFDTSDATISLSNRPLTCTMMLFGNSATPRTIQPRQFYQSTDSFASDMLTLHDTHLLHDLHAGTASNSHALLHLNRWTGWTLPSAVDGLSSEQYFVDDDWNMTCLIDLEWICVLPVDMLSVSYWLTDCSIDSIIDDEYAIFDQARQAFLAIMDEEARLISTEHDVDITSRMRYAWESKGVWFWACLRSINAWLFVFEDHILPKFFAEKERLTTT
ncbi:hypothetical protein XA68_12460 [Ophiocordyceps unilateralis]|uniref:Aminoglycoside phosphotransferase domain-containing protein n=1 Tax=Ophiocordyceps unilateralis TaxID=268505 RepID=A0A2A9PCY3_OPHUN|nr:hypothetical protein XA68_12460 [Ophiocordyceps unilateralis]